MEHGVHSAINVAIDAAYASLPFGVLEVDGTARGGVMVAAADQYGIPIHAIGIGEGMGDLRPFDAAEAARAIAGVAA